MMLQCREIGQISGMKGMRKGMLVAVRLAFYWGVV
jgi:hypothetical protein